MLFEWCRQAEERGLLQGDLSTVQAICKDIAKMNAIIVERKSKRRLYDKLDDMVEFWFAIEHHEMWERKKMVEKMREQEEETYVDLTAPDMMTMLEKVKRLTNMEGEGPG